MHMRDPRLCRETDDAQKSFQPGWVCLCSLFVRNHFQTLIDKQISHSNMLPHHCSCILLSRYIPLPVKNVRFSWET